METPLRIPRVIMQLALVLDSILATQPPTDAAPLCALQQGGYTTGTTADFSDLNPQDLSLLSGHVAIVSHELARRAAEIQATEDDSSL